MMEVLSRYSILLLGSVLCLLLFEGNLKPTGRTFIRPCIFIPRLELPRMSKIPSFSITIYHIVQAEFGKRTTQLLLSS